MNISCKFGKLIYYACTHNSNAFGISVYCYSSSAHLIERICQKHPELRVNKVTAVYDNLVSNGIAVENVDLMLSQCPELSKLPVSQLENNLKGWLQCQLGCDRVSHLLIKHAYLLFVSAVQIEDRFSKVASLFPQKKLFKAVLNSPTLFTENWGSIRQKMDYLTDRIKLSQSVIASSGALSHPLSHLQVRFEFLLRAGVYVLPKPKSSVIPKNPSVHDILCTSDTQFAKKVASLSALEFEAFKHMFTYEEDQSDIALFDV